MFLKNKKDISLLSLKITNKEELKKFLTPTVLRKREIQANYNCKELIVYKKSSKDKRFERKQLRLKKKLEKKIERDNKKKIVALKAHWINIMANKGLYNSEKFTYSLGNIKVTYFGYICDVRIPDGLNFSKLDAERETIEDNLGCTIVANKPKRSNIAHLELVYNTPQDKKFEPLEDELKLPPYKLFLGNGYNSEPIIADMIKWPHLLISGGTRSGKSKCVDILLTNLIHTCSKDEVELFLVQVAKSDLVLYEDCEHCRGFADNLDKTETLLNYLVDEIMVERDRMIRPLRKRADGDNYMDYNKVNSNNKITTIYAVFDEMASLFQTQGCSQAEKNQKIRIIAQIRKIAQYGASLGVFLIMSVQRPTKDNLDPFLKSQASFIVSFRQNNERSSDVALDDPKMALALEQREFIYHTNKYSYGLAPFITAKKVKTEIEYSFVPGHPTILDNLEDNFIDNDNNNENIIEEELNIEDFMDINNLIDIMNNETDDINLNMEPTREEILARNIADIPNFVPYEEPNENVIIRDETRPRNNNSGRRGRPRRNSNNTTNSNEEDVIRVSDNIFDD